MTTRLTLAMPESALTRLIERYRSGDPALLAMFDGWGVLAVHPHDEHALADWENEGGSPA